MGVHLLVQYEFGNFSKLNLEPIFCDSKKGPWECIYTNTTGLTVACYNPLPQKQKYLLKVKTKTEIRLVKL